MFFIKNLKIANKTILLSSLLFFIVIFFISLTLHYKVNPIAEKMGQLKIKENVELYTESIKATIPFSHALGFGDIFESHANWQKKFEQEEADNILLDLIRRNKYWDESYLGLWVVIGVDEGWREGNEGKPWLINSYWVRGKNQKPHKEPDIPLELLKIEDFYQVPKNTLKPAIIDPFLYPVGGKDVLMSSLAIPFFNKNGQFIGVAGIDVSLEQLDTQLDKHVIKDFENFYIDYYSNNGTLVYSNHNTAQIGKNIEYIEQKKYIDKIKSQQSFTHSYYNEDKKTQLFMSVKSAKIAEYAEPWTLVVQVPEKDLYTIAFQTQKIILITGFLGLLLLIVSMYFFIRSFIRPLLKVNKHLQLLSLGNIKIKDDIEYYSHDEISDLVNYAYQVKKSMCSTIELANSVAAGHYTQKVKLLSDDDQLGTAIENMTHSLQKATQKTQQQDWLKSGQALLSEEITGEQDIVKLAEKIINFIVPYLEAKVGIFYLYIEKELGETEEDKVRSGYLRMIATHAYVVRKHFGTQFNVGEGIVGQAALERKPFIVTDTPDDYMSIQTGLGSATPKAILVLPIEYESELKAIVELASLKNFTELQLEFLNQISNTIGTAVHTAEARTKMQELLQQSQQQAKELEEQSVALKDQQVELQQSNEELQSQSEELQTQQEELRQINEELEVRTQTLEQQRKDIHDKNLELEKTQKTIETKAKELELASKYKSEFLANMSHELRTPLNSMLILAQLLSKNKEKTLTEKQQEYAQTIHSAGSDLLNLINEILDLSKVEAGKLEAHISEVSVPDLLKGYEHKFQHVADEKSLDFSVKMDGSVPNKMHTDEQRLNQIINNLLSNAFKFTESGKVSINLNILSEDVPDCHLQVGHALHFTVKDTGIGIPKQKQKIIFEAFQQADGTTSRKFGGTGLGLAISRQLARLLGGDLRLHSVENEGSCFSLYLPIHLKMPSQETLSNVPDTPKSIASAAITESTQTVATVSVAESAEEDLSKIDDRKTLDNFSKRLLIIEDDLKFSKILIGLAHDHQFAGIIAEDGRTGVEYVDKYHPDAIILDLGLPKMDGLSVMEALKDNVLTRHIPIHCISASDETQQTLNMGAIGYILKPASMEELGHVFYKIESFINRTVKNALVLSDLVQHEKEISNLLENNDTQLIILKTGDKVLQYLKNGKYDVLILDAAAENHQSIKLLPQLAQQHFSIPTIIYSDRDLTQEEEIIIRECQQKITIKSVHSTPRLLDEATLFLHSVESHLPEEKRNILRIIHDKDALFKDKKIFIIDDDMRNAFALTTAFEDKDMAVFVGNNGKEALELFEEHPDVDLILMDIMMPQMDGYETMKKIRQVKGLRSLPIIALTAKAMKDDKAKCLEAGANDYLSKPVDLDKLLSLMRVWLHQ